MSLSVTVKGMEDLIQRFGQLPEKLFKRAVKNILFDIRADALKYIRAKFREPKSGLMYNRPGSRSKYRASAPGEPPAIRSGGLDRSLDLSRVEMEDLAVTIRAGGRLARHAIYLEGGTGEGYAGALSAWNSGESRAMAARPFFYNTVEERKEDWFKIVRADIEEQLGIGQETSGF